MNQELAAETAPLANLPALTAAHLDRARCVWQALAWTALGEALTANDANQLPDTGSAQLLTLARTLHGAPLPPRAQAGLDAAQQQFAALMHPAGTEVGMLDVAAERLQLGPAERLVLDVLAASEIDVAVGEARRQLAGRLGRDARDIGLLDLGLRAAGVPAGAAERALAVGGGLQRCGAAASDGARATLSPALLAFLAGASEQLPRLPAAVGALRLSPAIDRAHAELRAPLVATLSGALRAGRPVVLTGPGGFAGEALAAMAAARLGLPLRMLPAPALVDGKALSPVWPQLLAQARLEGTIWVLQHLHRLAPQWADDPALQETVLRALADLQAPAILLHEGPVPPGLAAVMASYLGAPVIEVAPLVPAERRVLLAAALQDAGVDAKTADSLGQSCEHHAMGAQQIDQAVSHALQIAGTRLAKNLAADSSPSAATAAPTALELRLACTTAMTSRLRQYGSRVDTASQWQDLVLADDVLRAVKDLARFARVRDRLFGEFGFGQKQSYGRALSAMFSGPSGTGKTMVAGLIARELGVELYRVDLSRVVSKYIGETEERLGALFAEASQVGAALLFDEADSLFGARTEIKSSNDRYANLEVNYLLQRLEEFDGVVILTTNFASTIDDAFLRRLRFRVQFPFPTPSERARLWEIMLPDAMPQHDDGIDFDWMGQTFELSGGHVRNAVLRAAMIAADAGKPLSNRMMYAAAAAEYRELGKLAPAYPFDDE